MKTLMYSIVLLFSFSINSFVFAEGSGKGGDEFRHTAEKYEAKAEKYASKGMPEVAALYTRQAEIKRHAASLADENRWDEVDWTEYHENEGRINENVSNMQTYHKNKKTHKK